MTATASFPALGTTAVVAVADPDALPAAVELGLRATAKALAAGLRGRLAAGGSVTMPPQERGTRRNREVPVAPEAA